MEKRRFGYALSLSVIVSLALVAFVSCIAAELHRTKIKDLKLDGKLCYLPESQAFAYGIAALVCLVMAQVIGSILLCTRCSSNSREKKNNDQDQSSKRSILATILLVVSWASFTVVMLLLSAASSMSRRQPYTTGWLGGECYLVKSGVYVAAATLILISTSSTVGSAVIVLRRSLQIDESRKITTLPK